MVYFSFFDLRESLLSLKEVLNFYDAQDFRQKTKVTVMRTIPCVTQRGKKRA